MTSLPDPTRVPATVPVMVSSNVNAMMVLPSAVETDSGVIVMAQAPAAGPGVEALAAGPSIAHEAAIANPNTEVVERQVLELLRWFDIPQQAQEDVAKAGDVPGRPRKIRDRSLQEIVEEERRWEFATTTPGMGPIQALEPVREFAKAIHESTPAAQREVVQRVFQRIAITDDRVTDIDVYPVSPRLSGGIGDPERIRTADLLRDREAC